MQAETKQLTEGQRVVFDLVQRYAPNGETVPWKQIIEENRDKWKHLRYGTHDGKFQKAANVAYHLRHKGLLPKTKFSAAMSNGHGAAKLDRPTKQSTPGAAARAAKLAKKEARELAEEQFNNMSPELRKLVEQKVELAVVSLMGQTKFCPRCGNDMTLLYHAQQLKQHLNET